jgi:pimeloyl-ACP methyl ester carboxylesterase
MIGANAMGMGLRTGSGTVFDEIAADGGSMDRAPVVLVHGASENRSVWRPLVARIAGVRRALVIDLPGHGETRTPAPQRVAGLADAIQEMLDELGLGPCILVGHSLGGCAVQELYRRHPEAVRAMGLISTSSNFGMPPETIDHWLNDLPAFRRDESVMFAAHLDLSTTASLDAMRQGNGDETIVNDLHAIAAWNNPCWRDIAVPALVLTASLDALYEAAQEFRSGLPDVTYVEIQDAGHMMLIDHGDETAAAVAQWLDQLPF